MQSYAVFAVIDFFAPYAQHQAEEPIAIEAPEGINREAVTLTLEHYSSRTVRDNGKVSQVYMFHVLFREL
jgi:hypothetical protein